MRIRVLAIERWERQSPDWRFVASVPSPIRRFAFPGLDSEVVASHFFECISLNQDATG